MLRKKLGLLVAVGISCVLVGCGPDCTSSCEQAQEDGDCFQEADGGNLDCEDFCEDVEDIAAEDNGDCEEDLDELLSCMNDEDDTCDALDDECTDELEDLQECIGEYCIDHPTNDSCEDLVFD